MRHLLVSTGRDFFQEVERLGLSLSQIKTLQLMSDREPDTIGALAADLGLSLPAVSRAVDGLHKRGLVKRVECSSRPPRQARVADRQGQAHRREPRGAARGGPARGSSRASSHTSATRWRTGSAPCSSDRRSRRWEAPDDRADPPERRQPPLVDARGHVLRAVHGDAGQHGRERGAALDPGRPGRLAVGPRVDGERVHAHLRRAAGHRRPPGRRVRQAPDVPGRRGGVRALQRRHRLRSHPGVAGGRARGPGHGRRVHDARHAVDHHQRLPARGARQGDRHLGRRVRAGPGDRPGGGRRADRVRVLARDLLPQPARGRGRGDRDAVRRPRVSRRDRGPGGGPRRHRDAVDRPHGAGAGAGGGQRMGLGLPRDPGPAGPGRGRPGGLRGARAARARARWWTSTSSARGRSWARTSWPSPSRSRCSRCSSSPRSTCRTSSATTRSRPGSGSCPPRP